MAGGAGQGSTGQGGLAGAYALDGQDACLRLYADWAQSYDAGFAAAMEYRLPAHVAAAFLAAGPPAGPVLDVGAGTGLCAAALRAQGFAGPIDGVDLSQEMLDVAAAKGVYRALYRADVTRPLNLPEAYAGVVSAGTFTSGHVGPGEPGEPCRWRGLHTSEQSCSRPRRRVWQWLSAHYSRGW